ncbi:MAG: phospho-sugar mutase [Paludibacteraceae bacterium]|nr:phospho-sugar mutase [Candidatus Physcocola equi]MCQ2234433.1 phospho-sugar mutase [Paludibacteraceae bacterium]
MDNTALINEVTAKANVWLNGNYDAETKSEIKKLLDNPDKTDLIEAFYKDLEFGTGGLRGIMGVGSNRMNRYTVGSATQGLANYLKKQFPNQQIKVVVGHDCRNNSRFFAETTADVLSANGIQVFLFESLRPTPEVSFAIRELGCQSGVNITASHNPKEYNGYKAYWNDGAQFVAPHDTNVIDEVLAIKSVDDVKFEGNKSLIKIIGKEIDAVYQQKICALSLSPDAIKRNADMKIVYTPIHGTGVMLIPDTLKKFGFNNIIDVPEQNVISGDFPTVVSPNPEEQAAMNMAIEKAKAVDADLVMASDPDADRVGSAIKNDKGEWMLVNGNQMGMLLTYYLLRRWKELGKLKGKEFTVKTIVTTELIKTISDSFNVPCFDVYTGFKWIADIILKQEGKMQYIGGGEESYGYLPQDFVRDKDAVSTCSMLAEVAAWAKDNGMSMYQLLCKVYAEFGFSLNKGISVVKKGKSGAEEIKAMMSNYRANPPKDLGGSKVVLVKDYETLVATDDKGNKTKLEMPTTSNVLQFFTEDGSKVSVRPSGTEPKIKFYIEVLGKMESVSDYDKAAAAANAKIEAFKASLGV